MGNASAESAMTAAGGAAEDGPEAAAEAVAYREGATAKPADRPTMTKTQQRHWYKQEGKKWHWIGLRLTSVHENRPGIRSAGWNGSRSKNGGRNSSGSSTAFAA